MGNVTARFNSDYAAVVKTGDRKGAGTDANVFAQLQDESGVWTDEVRLSSLFRNDHERNSTGIFYFPKTEGFGRPSGLRIWRDRKGVADDWYLEEVVIIERLTGDPVVVFPINRWLQPDRQHFFPAYDAILPHLDERINQRSEELSFKRQLFEYTQHWDGCPVMGRCIPITENAPSYLRDQRSIRQKLESKLINVMSSQWKDLSDLKDVYKLGFVEPQCVARWKDDTWFGAQRLQGLNPMQIKLCTDIPESFQNASASLSPHIEGMSLEDACRQNKIFVVDFSILQNLPCKDDRTIVAPVGLFYLNRKQNLLPIGIRLFPGSSHDNPIFTPSDPPFTWMMAKMYFNNADATVHRVWNAFGLTHCVLESIWVCTNRTLSPSHPIFRLLAPFFQNILQANQQLLERLMAPGGWFDQCTTVGMRGMAALLSRCFQTFRLPHDLNLPQHIEKNGLQKDVLPKFPFRDDGIQVYEAIQKYVTKIINHYYDTLSNLVEDLELREWHRELSADRKLGGCEIKGLPQQQFKTNAELVDTLTAIIAAATMYSSAYNQAQYDECAFLLNYPVVLRGNIPRNNGVRNEWDVVNHLPSRETTIQIMNTLRMLSTRQTRSLGDFPVRYLRHPKDEEALNVFVEELKDISAVIKERNNVRQYQYIWLDPAVIPNGVAV